VNKGRIAGQSGSFIRESAGEAAHPTALRVPADADIAPISSNFSFLMPKSTRGATACTTPIPVSIRGSYADSINSFAPFLT
jgi:hypothetical protein